MIVRRRHFKNYFWEIQTYSMGLKAWDVKQFVGAGVQRDKVRIDQ